MGRNLKVLAVAIVGAVLSTAQTAEAGAPARFPFRNASGVPIIVVLDSDREVMEIGPGGQTSFVKGNVGDICTFRVYLKNADGSRGTCLAGESYSTFTGFPPRLGGRDLKFTGSKIEED